MSLGELLSLQNRNTYVGHSYDHVEVYQALLLIQQSNTFRRQAHDRPTDSVNPPLPYAKIQCIVPHFFNLRSHLLKYI